MHARLQGRGRLSRHGPVFQCNDFFRRKRVRLQPRGKSVGSVVLQLSSSTGHWACRLAALPWFNCYPNRVLECWLLGRNPSVGCLRCVHQPRRSRRPSPFNWSSDICRNGSQCCSCCTGSSRPPRFFVSPRSMRNLVCRYLECHLTTRWSESAAGSFGEGRAMLQFRIKWLRSVAEMPRFAQRGR